MVRSASQSPAELSDKMATPPTDGAVTNAMLMAASTWPISFDIRTNHVRCGRCRQSIQSMGKNGIGYTGDAQTLMGLVVMHMIQVHKYTREGIIDG